MSFEACLKGIGSSLKSNAAEKLNFGVAWEKQSFAENQPTIGDVRRFTRPDSKRFLRDRYWNKIAGDDIISSSSGLANALFDAAIHHGPAKAVQLLQQLLPKAIDVEDKETYQKLLHSIQNLLPQVFEARRGLYEQTLRDQPENTIFEHGWMNELEKSMDKSKQLEEAPSTGGVDFTAVLKQVGAPKGYFRSPYNNSLFCIFDSVTTTENNIQGQLMAGALLYGRKPGSVWFSLDPWIETQPDGPHLRKVYSPPEMAGSVLGDVLFEADFLLKKLSMGLEPIPDALAQAGLRSLMDLQSTDGQVVRARLWFYIDEVITRDEDNSFDVVLKVNARRRGQTVDGSLEDIVTDPNCNEAQFASNFSHLFKLAAKHFSILQQLEDAARCIVLAQNLVDDGLTLDVQQLALLARSNQPHEFKIDALDNVQEDVKVEVSETAKGTLTTTTRRTRTLHGGVSFTVPTTVNPTLSVTSAVKKDLISQVILQDTSVVKWMKEIVESVVPPSPITTSSTNGDTILCLSLMQINNNKRCSVCKEAIIDMGDEATECRYHSTEACAFCFKRLKPTQARIQSELFGYSNRAHPACLSCFACNQVIESSFVVEDGLFFHPNCPVTIPAYPEMLLPDTWQCLLCEAVDNLYPADQMCRACQCPREKDIAEVARELYQQTQYVRAVRLYLRSSTAKFLSSVKRAAVFANICVCYVKLKEFAKALDAINEACKHAPDNPRYILKRADVRMAVRDWQGALADFEQYSKVTAKLPDKDSDKVRMKLEASLETCRKQVLAAASV